MTISIFALREKSFIRRLLLMKVNQIEKKNLFEDYYYLNANQKPNNLICC